MSSIQIDDSQNISERFFFFSINPMLNPESFLPDQVPSYFRRTSPCSLRSVSQSCVLPSTTTLTKSIQTMPLPHGNMWVGIGWVAENNKSLLVLGRNLSKSELGSKKWFVNPSAENTTPLVTQEGKGYPPSWSFSYAPGPSLTNLCLARSNSTGKWDSSATFHPALESRIPCKQTFPFDFSTALRTQNSAFQVGNLRHKRALSTNGKGQNNSNNLGFETAISNHKKVTHT